MIQQPKVVHPDLCVIHTSRGERINSDLAAILDPVDPATFHEFVLEPNRGLELHGHDYDEYWWFTGGKPLVTLWTPGTGPREYQLQPGDLVILVRGMAHTLRAADALIYHQFSSVLRPGARQGQLEIAQLKMECGQ